VGQKGREALLEHAAKLDLQKWPGPVIAMYLEKISTEALWNATRDANQKTQTERECAANFYIGEYLLLQNLKDQAVQRFQAALATRQTTLVEYASAKAELNRMGY
jgi:lipoprotein NlpI